MPWERNNLNFSGLFFRLLSHSERKDNLKISEFFSPWHQNSDLTTNFGEISLQDACFSFLLYNVDAEWKTYKFNLSRLLYNALLYT